MAYLLQIENKCIECHTRPATVELRNRFNESHGQFCSACGKRRLKDLQDDEANAKKIRSKS